jgi:hypothetical protein
MAAVTPRPRAVIRARKANAPAVLQRAKIVYAAMLLNVASFAAPTVTMVAFLALITALDALQQQITSSRARGLGAQRNSRRDLVWTALESLRAYTQGLADALTPENAIGLIQSAGFEVADVGKHDKPVFQVVAGPEGSGLVHLIANVGILVGKTSKKVTFNWQWSNTNGASWNDLPSTPLADTYAGPLPLGVTYWFRVSVTIGRKTGEPTQPVILTLH